MAHGSAVAVCLLALAALTAQASGKEFNPTTNLILPESSSRLESINGTRNYRMHGKKGKDDKTWFDGREMRYIYCVRPGKCEPIKHRQCLHSTLPYSSISLDLTDSYSQEEMHTKLHQYNALKSVPKCWAVIQPFLCAVFTPKCEKINGQDMVYLPTLEMCKLTLEPCRILHNTSFFPEFLKCNETLYPSKCNNDVREEMKFNASGQCQKPLVAADLPANYYKEIDGCGVQCKDPLYTDHEHRQIHKLVAWGASICLAFNLFTLATFAIDWQNANKYPAMVIFYINFCFAVSCLGWLAQFTPGGREDIVCRKDGTLRTSEPSAGENLSCIVVFILVYYFLIAAMIQDRIDKKGSYFHLIAWSLPLVLTITIMALSEIDGNSTVGICFVGYQNHPIRGAFLLGPVLCVLLVGGYFLGRGLLTLIRLRISSRQIISARASKKIHQTIVRMGVCTTFTFIFIVATAFCHVHEFRHSAAWAEALRGFLVCQIVAAFNDDVTNGCRYEQRPSVAILQLHLICLFASGIVMSSWVWTNSTLESWGRYFRRRFGTDIDEPVKLQKHKVIAQAFAKRKEFQNQGRLSISFHNSHTDPVGLKFDITSAIGSHDFSSTWANNLPRFVNRRCALTGAATSSSHDPRKNSVDSEISFSVRHVSVESRRNSIDSQVSVKIAEVKTKVASRSSRGTVVVGATGSKHGHKSRQSRRRHDFATTATGRRYGRKESSTSVESQIVTAAIQKSAGSGAGRYAGGVGTFGAGSMQRRTGIGALDAHQINDLISNGKLLLPFLQGQGLTTSEDDNVSITSGREEHHSKDFNGSIAQSAMDGGGASARVGKSRTVKRQGANQLGSFRKGGNGLRPRRSLHSTARRKKEKNRERERKREKELALLERAAPSSSPPPAGVETMFDFNDSSFTSYCSELSPLHVNSSYSGVSVAKTNSRNSKRSCDVGIQTNAHEIATQTMSSFEFSEKALKNEENADIYTENHHPILSHHPVPIAALQAPSKMIQTVGTNTIGGGGRKHRDASESTGMSDAEKLKMLLLPSK
ncbi:AGAP008625-PA [Anopheles gambiae str. PEST]|uniref:Protein smoothened n=1 Tax=Anopheles gambiae TaxID=7165 RepID=Q7PPM7_ANOGA|nr:AGAP008625-PA [Anopheles gambiae str. PEST]